MGRYELVSGLSAETQIRQRQAKASNDVTSLANNGLESYQSLFSQIRELTKSSSEEKNLEGEVSLAGQWSNGQPEYSAQDNNYYEVRGRIASEVMDIPISIDGFYTTQDARRQVKASYIHASYDADKAKEKLLTLINGYKNQYTSTLSKGKGLEQIYGSYLGSLESAKASLWNNIKTEYGIEGFPNGVSDNTWLQEKNRRNPCRENEGYLGGNATTRKPVRLDRENQD